MTVGTAQANVQVNKTVHIEVKSYTLPANYTSNDVDAIKKLPSHDILNVDYHLNKKRSFKAENTSQNSYIASSKDGKLTPGVIKTGFIIRINPLVKKDNIILKNHVSYSKLNKLKDFNNGQDTVQLPEVTSSKKSYTLDLNKETSSENSIKNGDDIVVITETVR